MRTAASVHPARAARAARRALCLTAFGLLAALASLPAHAATTWLQGRAVDQETGGSAASGRDMDLASGSFVPGIVGSRGVFLMSELLPGSEDAFCFGTAGLIEVCNETRYMSLTPELGARALILQETELVDWRTQADMEGDGTLGQVFGVVRDAAGAGVAGATISVTPASGTLWYIDSAGVVSATGPTDASGRFILLDTAPGALVATATAGGPVVGLAYGTAADDRTLALDLRPPLTLAGTARDENAATISGAAIAWDFDPAVSTTSAAGGAWTLSPVAAGLDVTVRGSRTGFRDASTFRYSAAEAPSTGAINLRFFSAAAYTNAQAGFGVIQASSLGILAGRVLDTLGQPVSQAVVTVDPAVGTVLYYGPGHVPNPALTSTSSDGGYIVFNVPAGNVVLSAVAPGFTIRSAVAPSLAGGVTVGDLGAYESQQVTGTVFDESSRALPVGGAIVQVFEFPFISVIVGADGQFTLDGVPRNTLVSLRASRTGYIDSYTFRRDTGPAASRTQDLFLPSESSVTQLYTDRSLPYNRARSTIGVTVDLSNGQGVIGLNGQATPVSGSVGYPGPGPNRKTAASATTLFGNINILSVTPGDGGLLVEDPRNDFFTFNPAPLVANGVVVDEVAIPCDAGAMALANLYPCDGAVYTSGAAPADFQWDDDQLGNLSFQVQFSLDPSFSTIEFSSKDSDSTFLTSHSWRPGKKKWKKILALATGGTPVYWRVQQREKVSGSTSIDTFSAPTSFTAP